jgi:hypothetical protein
MFSPLKIVASVGSVATSGVDEIGLEAFGAHSIKFISRNGLSLPTGPIVSHSRIVIEIEQKHRFG